MNKKCINCGKELGYEDTKDNQWEIPYCSSKCMYEREIKK